MKFNQIIKNDANINNYPLTKKFTLKTNDVKIFRIWNPFQSTLSAAISCGLEIIPINKNSSLLNIRKIHLAKNADLVYLATLLYQIFDYQQ